MNSSFDRTDKLENRVDVLTQKLSGLEFKFEDLIEGIKYINILLSFKVIFLISDSITIILPLFLFFQRMLRPLLGICQLILRQVIPPKLQLRQKLQMSHQRRR